MPRPIAAALMVLASCSSSGSTSAPSASGSSVAASSSASSSTATLPTPFLTLDGRSYQIEGSLDAQRVRGDTIYLQGVGVYDKPRTLCAWRPGTSFTCETLAWDEASKAIGCA